MPNVKCSRCGEAKEGLAEAPFDNELGQKVFENVCADCWQAWVGQQLMIMNEMRLDPVNEEHSKLLDREMLKFLNLE